MVKKGLILSALILMGSAGAHADEVRIGLNYPETGPYAALGEPQIRAANLAIQEINAAGGIAGKTIQLVTRDTKSNAERSKATVGDLIDKEGCQMIFGGVSSSVAIAGGNAARERQKLYLATMTYSNATTGKAGHKYIFRECYNAWMGAKILSDYLRGNHSGKRYFYIIADYTWGWTTEESIRTFSLTLSRKRHKRVLVPFPGATAEDYKNALKKAEASKADVLVIIIAGKGMADALKSATEMGIKQKMAIVVPALSLGMVEAAGPKVMEGVVGASPWCWRVPYGFDHERGKQFVEKFASRYHSYPSTPAASAYTNLHQYKDAVERAGTFDTKAVVTALEGHTFVSLKDEQMWRDFEHQCIQTDYSLKCKPEREVLKDRFKQDYFEIMSTMSGKEAAMDKARWIKVRKKAGVPPKLEW